MELDTRELSNITGTFVGEMRTIHQTATERFRTLMTEYLTEIERLKLELVGGLSNVSSEVLSRLSKLKDETHVDIDKMAEHNQEFVLKLNLLLAEVMEDLKRETKEMRVTLKRANEAVVGMLEAMNKELAAIPKGIEGARSAILDMTETSRLIRDEIDDIQSQLQELNLPGTLAGWSRAAEEINGSTTTIVKTLQEIRRLNETLMEGKEERIAALIPVLNTETHQMLNALESFRRAFISATETT